MFRVIRVLFKGKNLKISLIVFGAIASILAGGIGYTMHLRSTVSDLRESNELIQQNNAELRTQINENQLRFHREVNALNKSFEQYSELLRGFQLQNENLQRGFNEITDENIRQCLDIQLPDDVVDSLFPIRG